MSASLPPCPICGGTAGRCQFTGKLLVDDPLTAADWRELYEFIVTVELPFIHALITKARARSFVNRSTKLSKKSQRKPV